MAWCGGFLVGFVTGYLSYREKKFWAGGVLCYLEQTKILVSKLFCPHPDESRRDHQPVPVVRQGEEDADPVTLLHIEDDY